MPQISHGYAIGRVRTLEKRFLSPQHWERFVACRDIPELTKALAESGWGEAQDQAGVDRLCDRHVLEACELIRAITPEPEITDCFFLKYDIINLKALLKARMTDQAEPALSENGLLDPQKLRHAVSERSYKELPEEFRETLEQIEERVAADPDPLYVDSRLDKLLYQIIEQRVKRALPEVREYFACEADSVNLLIALRVRRMGRPAEFAEDLFVPGGKISLKTLATLAKDPDKLRKIAEGTPYAQGIGRALEQMDRGAGLSAIEGEMERYRKDLLKKGKRQILGILPVIEYLAHCEREAQNVRLIAVAKAVGISMDALAARLDD